MDKKECVFVFIIVTLLSISLVGGAKAQGVISLPWTGQSKCYNSSGTEISCAGTGQDGELQVGVDWPDPRFTVSGDCVTDNLTGLMWAKNGNLPNGTQTWQGALDYVASINAGSGLCGYKDWRLPNINELESLVNAGEANSATWLNTQGFSNVQSDFYWSSTTNANSTDCALFVHVWSGFVGYGSRPFLFYIWPVRSGQSNSPDPSYPANIWKTGQTASYALGDDGDLERGVAWPKPRFTAGTGAESDCVTDNLTGLMWTKNANLAGGTKTWQGALDYVKSLNSGAGLCGYHNWRLPNRKEFFSLIDHSEYNPSLPTSHPFQNVSNYQYWSSTTLAYDTSRPSFVSIADGAMSWSVKDDNYFVWPVRSASATSDIIELFGLEVTQGIQDLKNSVPLIKDKPTFVRAHVRSTSENITGVTANLIGTRIEGSTKKDLGTLTPDNNEITVTNFPADGVRLNLDAGLYFRLPEDWLNGTVDLEFKVDGYEKICNEPKGNNGNDIANDCKAVVTLEENPPFKDTFL